VDIARFGEKKLDLLRRFQPFRDGTPSHDHLGDIFATLDASLLRFLGGGADRRTGRCDRHRRQDELIKAHVSRLAGPIHHPRRANRSFCHAGDAAMVLTH
jgi:transcriptional regulator of aromatic amino acid metabolism